MFARTPRLLLRPGFPEDAPALAVAIADEAIACNLAVVPWPYTLRDAEAFLASPRDPVLPSLLSSSGPPGAPELVGILRPRAAAVRGGRAGLLDRARTLGPRLRDRGLLGPDRYRPDARSLLDSKRPFHRQPGFGAGAGEARLRAVGDHRSAHELRARRRGAGAADEAEAQCRCDRRGRGAGGLD